MEVFLLSDNINHTPYRIVTAPVLLPDVPDCDYKNGEIPLTTDQIQHLQTSYKNYQIIDYDHQFCLNGDWYMKKIGTPLESWISSKNTTYTDITGTTRDIPAGSWWLKSKITDPTAIRLIDDGKLTAYSLTTANQIYADKIIDLLNNGLSQSNKNNSNELDELAVKSRTLIKDIDNPVGFTVSLTAFPCVSNAVFSKQCLFQSQKNSNTKEEEDDIMTENEKTTTKYTIDDIKSIFNLFSKKADNNEKEGEETTKKEDNTNKEEDNSGSKYATKDDITKINNRLDELADKIDKLQKGNKKEEEDGDKTSKTQKEDDTSKTSEKNETTANKNIKSKEIPHNHDGINNTSYKHTNPEAHLMESLGRDQYGISKFKQNNIFKGDE